MSIVGLMGIKRSGKSTCAEHLVKNNSYEEISFAGPLKKALKELFILDDNQLYGTQEEKEAPDNRWYGCSARKMLQFVGTDLLRDNMNKIMPGIGKDIFVRNFELWYLNDKQKNPNKLYVIPDVRFQNEVDYIQKLGGIVIKINRPSLESNDPHPSEIELLGINNYDYLLENDSTLENLKQKLEAIFDMAEDAILENQSTILDN